MGSRSKANRLSHAMAFKLYKALERDAEALAQSNETLVKLAARYGNEIGTTLNGQQISDGFDVVGITLKGRKKPEADSETIERMQSEIDRLTDALQSALDRLEDIEDRLTAPGSGAAQLNNPDLFSAERESA